MQNIKIIILLLTFISAANVNAQMVIADPGSVAQRAGLFFTELEEAISQRFEIVRNSDNSDKLVNYNSERLEKLKNVSQFVKSAQEIIDIYELGEDILGYIKYFQNEIDEMDHLTVEEQYNALCFIVSTGEHIADIIDKAKESVNKKNNGEMSDFERIELLKDIKAEVKVLKTNIYGIKKRYIAQNSKETLKLQLKLLSTRALTKTSNNQLEESLK